MKLTTWIIKLAPIGVMFLIAGDILQEKEVAKSFASLGLYFATVVVGLTIHGTIVLPTIYGNSKASMSSGFPHDSYHYRTFHLDMALPVCGQHGECVGYSIRNSFKLGNVANHD